MPEEVRTDAQELERFRLSLDILLGRKRRFDAQPMRYFMPNLPVVEFFDRKTAPWLDAVEAQTDAIRGEFLSVLAATCAAVQCKIPFDRIVPFLADTEQALVSWRLGATCRLMLVPTYI